MTTHPGPMRLLAWSAVASSGLYFLSDVIEVAQGGFSVGQLWLTLVAEALVPAVVVGLAVVQWPRIGRLGVAGALGYGYAFVYFTATVIYALARDVHDFAELGNELGLGMTVHGAAMVLGGLAFGYRTARVGVLPCWTGVTFAVGVVTVALGLPGWAGLAAAGVRDLALAGMGLSLLADAAQDDRPSSESRWMLAQPRLRPRFNAPAAMLPNQDRPAVTESCRHSAGSARRPQSPPGHSG